MGPSKKRKAPSSSELAELADDLNENPRQKANNVPVLISYLTSKDHQVRLINENHMQNCACTYIFLNSFNRAGFAHHPGLENILCRML